MEEQEKSNVLIVDDRPENLIAMEGVLDRPELNIVTADSGNEALACMLEHDFAVVLLDVQMPEMDGFETAQLMRGNSRTSHVPVVFVTAISKDREFVFKGYESGAVDYLFKPVDPTILESKVKVFCELHRQRRVIERQVAALEAQLTEIKTLQGLVPICGWCKKVRDDAGFWQSVEVYVSHRTDANFTHGICPKCEAEYMS